jgi:hypothetical protein
MTTQASEIRGITLCVSKAGLTAGTTSTYTTAAAVNGFIGGKYATALAAQTNTATPTTDANGDAFTVVTASQCSVFVYCITAAGAIAVYQGTVEDLDSDAVDIRPSFPTIDYETHLPFGYVVVVNSSAGSDWTFGASNWTATGVTDTYTDVGVLPSRPQSS